MKRTPKLRWLGLLIQIGLGIFALYWIITFSHLDAAQFVQRLSETSFLPLVVSICCFVATMGLGALRYYLFLPTTISFTYLVGTTLFQNALLTFIPWRIGEIGYPLLLRRDYNVPVANSAAVILTIRLADVMLILAVALAGSAQLHLDARGIGIILGAVITLTLVAVLGLVKWRDKILESVRVLISAIEPMRAPRRLASFILLSLAVFALTTLQSRFALQAMALTLTVPNVALLNALTLLSALLPIHPPGGWGTMDSLQVLLLGQFGYSPQTSTSAILAAHSFYMLLIFTGGVVGWSLLQKSRLTSKIGMTS